MPAYVMDNVMRIQGEMSDVAGVHSVTLGKRAVGVSSGKAMQVLSEQDTPVVECSQFIVQHVPRATLEIIPAKSHWTHLEAPEKFLAAVDRFVTRLATGKPAN